MSKLDDIIIPVAQNYAQFKDVIDENDLTVQRAKQAIKDLIDELVGPKANTEGKTALELFTEIQDRAERLL